MEPLPPALPQNMMGHVYTPHKEPPPSLSFGSSSSPAFESPPTVGKELRFMHWSPPQERVKKSNVPQLLPSHFPPQQFGTIPSSPPEPRSAEACIENGSPRPRRAARSRSQDYGVSTVSMKRKTNAGRRGRPPKMATTAPAKLPSPIAAPISFPLLSSRAFEEACTNRNRRQHNFPSPNSLEDRLDPELEPVQEQFPSRGLGLSFIIDLNGKANVNPLILTPPSPQSQALTSEQDSSAVLMTPHTRQTVDAILDEESDLESDGEFEENTDKLLATPEMATRTPPRFSSLGNSDAAAAFARTLARSREVGKGSMFLFPPTVSPRKQPELTPYMPYLPETPRRSAGSDASAAFEFGLQTPQNSMYSFEASGAGYYATGMTPYLSVARAHEIANI